MLDSPEGVCAGQAGSEYPATSVSFSKSISLKKNTARVPLGVCFRSTARVGTSEARIDKVL
jgi:hypothetical protein